MAGRILVADDDWFSRQVYADCLRQQGHEVEAVPDAEQVLERLEAGHYDLIVTDVVMPGMDGLELLERVKEIRPHLDVIVLTGLDSVDAAVRAMRSGAHHYLVKPVRPEALQLTVRRCLESRRLLRENRSLRRSFELFEITQRLLACLERDRLRPMSLDALQKVGGADAALLCQAEPAADALELLEHRGLEPAAAARLARRLEKAAAGAVERGEPAPLADADRLLRGVEPPFAHGLVVPLRRRPSRCWAVLLRAAAAAPFDEPTVADVGFVARYITIALDNSSRYTHARTLAHRDGLTGLNNARYLELVLEREIARRERSGDPFSVLFMDLDHFKQVNDQHGHQVGSRLLAELGRLLRRCVREDDVLVRYGGDEFVAVLLDAPTEEAVAVGERIRKTVEQHRFLSREGLHLRVSLCVGVATWPVHARTRDDILHRADIAMYHGKHRERNVVYVFDDVPPADDAGEPAVSRTIR